MEKVLEKLEKLESGEVGIIVYSQLKQDIVLSLNKGLLVPLASAAKVAIAFCIAKLVEERHYKWTDMIENITLPSHFLNHMTGGLDHVVVDIGIMGEFSKMPLLYVLGAKELPNRYKENFSDEIIIDAMKLLYDEYYNQEVELESEHL